MDIILLAVLNNKRVIGKNGSIPWKFPQDMQRFKQRTVHHTVLMGRKTFESIGKVLPDRRNIVLTRGNSISLDVEQFGSIEDALNNLSNEEKVFVIGGGEVFRQTIDRADALMLTIVDDNQEGDVVFPVFEDRLGKSLKRISMQQMNGFRFEEYIRTNNFP